MVRLLRILSFLTKFTGHVVSLLFLFFGALFMSVGVTDETWELLAGGIAVSFVGLLLEFYITRKEVLNGTDPS